MKRLMFSVSRSYDHSSEKSSNDLLMYLGGGVAKSEAHLLLPMFRMCSTEGRRSVMPTNV
jgi:hypothetical protein